MISLLEALEKSRSFLERKGVPQARLDAEYLFADALGLAKRLDLYLQFDRPLGEAEQSAIRERIQRRGRREPLQHILGTVPFYGLTLTCDRRALTPRPETERLAEMLSERLRDTPPDRILDLGTGGGCLALALAKCFPNARVLATDSSPEALALARENAQRNGLAGQVDLRQSDWFDAIGPEEGPFGLIVSNPPYLTRDEWREAEPEVREFEPEGALVAEEGGLAELARIVAGATAYLSPGGLLALETGVDQHDRLGERAQPPQFARFESIADLQGRDRFMLLHGT